MITLEPGTRCNPVPLRLLSALIAYATLAVSAFALPAEVHHTNDVRIVNDREVDLTPLQQWFRKHDGERPLRAWKRVQVTEIKGVTAGMDRCMTKDEEGFPTEVLLASLPAALKAFLNQSKQQETRILAAREEVAIAEKAAADLSVSSHAANTRARSARIIHSQANAATAQLKRAREQLAKLEADHQAFLRKGPEQTTVLAMSTGKTFSNLAILDCGRPKH